MTSMMTRPASAGPQQPREIRVTRRPEKLVSDDRRVITRFANFGDDARARSVLARLVGLDEHTVETMLAQTSDLFSARHRGWANVMHAHFNRVRHLIDDVDRLSESHRMLIGAYFTSEYAIESAALFNPSIVPHPNQAETPAGAVRFLLSLQATGEGHLSSIVFRRGMIDKVGDLHFDPPPRYAYTGQFSPDKLYDKPLFFRKLLEMGDRESLARDVLDPVPERFTRQQLEDRLGQFRPAEHQHAAYGGIVADMRWICEANYTLRFPADAKPSETVIFPATFIESQGMEDLRLTQFTGNDGSRIYYGTYTAFDGRRMLPMLLETPDFKTFHVSTLNGPHARNHGMALFPRKIGGKYYCIGREDGESLYLLQSDDVHFWYEGRQLAAPREPWELTQIGNCGAPIECAEGFILLTHGVGPVRRYGISAMLLDKDEPWRVLGRLRQPLISPEEDEREGYVPNVVYSCGAMAHGKVVIIPYATSDAATTFATVPMDDLIARLLSDGP